MTPNSTPNTCSIHDKEGKVNTHSEQSDSEKNQTSLGRIQTHTLGMQTAVYKARQLTVNLNLVLRRRLCTYMYRTQTIPIMIHVHVP